MNDVEERHLLTLSIEELEKRLERAEYYDHCDSMSDDFYYGSGRRAAAQKDITAIKRALAAKKEKGETGK